MIKSTLTALLTLGLAGTALACPMDGGKTAKHSQSSHQHASLKGDSSPSSQAFAAANATMHKGMDIEFTGNADIDFLRGMIPHHQGAVEMAQIQLKYGNDSRTKKLAREIIRAQNLEIFWMQKWLAQLEAKQKGAQDKDWLGIHRD